MKTKKTNSYWQRVAQAMNQEEPKELDLCNVDSFSNGKDRIKKSLRSGSVQIRNEGCGQW